MAEPNEKQRYAHIRIVTPLPVEQGEFVEYPKPRVFAVGEDGVERELRDVCAVVFMAKAGEIPSVLLELIGVETDVSAPAPEPKEPEPPEGD
jgi:hypothetical protein